MALDSDARRLPARLGRRSRTIRAFWFSLLLLPACGGGARGMDRGPLEAIADEQQREVDDAEIARTLQRRPQLPRRVRIGVWFKPPGEATWEWTFEDRQRLMQAADDLDDVELFTLSRSFVPSSDLRALRLAAAQHGAHAVLVVEGRPQQRTADNGWLVTYPLLIPILFAPAAELDTRFSVDAALYDVGNGFLYSALEAEGLEEQQRAHVWIDHAGGIREARERAMGFLQQELRDRLFHLLAEREPVQAAASAGDHSESEGAAGASSPAESPTGASSPGASSAESPSGDGSDPE